MATETLELGPTPAEESCAQVGSDNYFTNARAECHRYIELLKKKFGTPPGNARFVVKSNPHDFGSYLEVAIKFNFDSELESAFAYHVENNLPGYWTDDASVLFDASTISDE